MCRRREYRLVENIFPVAGELLLADDACRNRTLHAAGTAHNHTCADLSLRGIAEGQARKIEAAQGLQQTEAGFLVVTQHMPRGDLSTAGADPYGLRLGDQVTDGQNHAVVADLNAVTRPLRAEGLGGEGVGRDDRANAYDRRKRILEPEIVILGVWLHERGRPLLAANRMAAA
jgi:hypothetical protein